MTEPVKPLIAASRLYTWQAAAAQNDLLGMCRAVGMVGDIFDQMSIQEALEVMSVRVADLMRAARIDPDSGEQE